MLNITASKHREKHKQGGERLLSARCSGLPSEPRVWAFIFAGLSWKCSAGPDAAAVRARTSVGLPLQLQLCSTGQEFCSTHCSSRAKASDPSLRAPPITKATFRVRKELFHLSPSSREQPGFSSRSRDLTAITAQTICIACHNAQKPSATLQQAALTAGNRPRSDFPKNNPLFKCNKHYPHPWQRGTFAYGSPGRWQNSTCPEFNSGFAIPVPPWALQNFVQMLEVHTSTTTQSSPRHTRTCWTGRN